MIPIPGCGAKYLVRLGNHLADVHQLDHTQRRKYLQEAKASGVGKKKTKTKTIKGRNIYLLSGLPINDRRKNTLQSVKQFITPQITRMSQIQVRNIASLL